MPTQTLTSAQCRAARAFLNWSRETLAAAADVSVRTIADFESETRQPIASTHLAIGHAFTRAGVQFALNTISARAKPTNTLQPAETTMETTNPILIQQNLAAIVRRTRKSHAWARNELARRADLPIGAITGIESGKRKFRLDELPLLADALGLDAEALAESIGVPKSEVFRVLQSAAALSPMPSEVVKPPVPEVKPYHWLTPFSAPKNGRLIIGLGEDPTFVFACRYVRWSSGIYAARYSRSAQTEGWLDIAYDSGKAPTGGWIPFPALSSGLLPRCPEHFKQQPTVLAWGFDFSDQIAEAPKGEAALPAWANMSSAPHNGDPIITLSADFRHVAIVRRGRWRNRNEPTKQTMHAAGAPGWFRLDYQAPPASDKYVAWIPCPFIDPNLLAEIANTYNEPDRAGEPIA
jgi:transcriptional regulator with XRE-family HTH domain